MEFLRECDAKQWESLPLGSENIASVQHSIQRVRERVKKGGHVVPIIDLKRRFLPSLYNFLGLYLPLADRAILYNSTLHPPKLVATWREGKFELHSPRDYESIRSR